MDITIVYEDDAVLVIDKPAGISVHPDGKTSEMTVSAWFEKRCPQSGGVGEPFVLPDGSTLLRSGIMHRLDKDTTGVLILSKTQPAFEFLKKQFKERTVKKIYNAFVYGEIKDDEGVINRPIGRSAKDFRLRSAQRGARGESREAITHYRVVQRGKGVTYVEFMPRTGRTHQIRVHTKAINHPILCDPLYAPNQACILGFTRIALHARSLEIAIPEKGAMHFEAPMPDDFKEALKSVQP